MEALNEYEKPVQDLLQESAIGFRVELVGNDCPMFCEDKIKGIDLDKLDTYPRKTHIHGKHYRAFFNRQDGPKTKTVSFEFWNSYANEEENFFAFGKHASLNNWIMGRENCYWDKYRINGKYPNPPRLKNRNIPSAYDVLSCLQKYPVGTFEDFCGEFGYDTDSRRAEITWHAVEEEYRKVRAFFTPAELEKLTELAQ